MAARLAGQERGDVGNRDPERLGPDPELELGPSGWPLVTVILIVILVLAFAAWLLR